MFEELDVVILTVDIPQYQLSAGTEGTVVDVLGNGQEYTVEFFDAKGHTLEVVSVSPDHLRPLIAQKERVVLTADLPEYHLLSGDLGVVIESHFDYYRVEFSTLDGTLLAVVSVRPDQLRPVGNKEIAHVRALE